MVTFEYQVTDPEGLHARPAGLLVKFAQGCSSSVSIQKGTRKADAKRLFSVMGLAVKQNDTVAFILDGESEQQDGAELKAFCEQNI